MSEPIEPVQAEAPGLSAVPDPSAVRQRAIDALCGDPGVKELLSSLKPGLLLIPQPRSLVDCFRTGYEDQMRLLKGARADGTLDILEEVGGGGNLNERIREVRTLRAVLRASRPSEPVSSVSKPKRPRVSRRRTGKTTSWR